MLNLEMALDIIGQSGFEPLLVDEATGSRAFLHYAARNAADQQHRELIRRLLERTEPVAGDGSRPAIEPVRSHLQFVAFGSSTVRRNGEVVDAQELRLRAKEMLFFLLAHPVVTKERVVAALWPELSLAKAHSSFHFYLFQVRRLLGGTEAISYEGGAYRLESRQYRYDVDEFHRNLAKAEKTSSGRRENYLREAIALYSGDYLEDVYSDWTEEFRLSLRRQYHQALEELAAHCRARGRLDEAAEWYRKVLDKDVLREDIHRQLIETLVDLGDRAGAIRQSEHLQEVLYEELGAEPSEETTSLVRGLLVED
jgi:two-component SAPR family response regulator